MGAYRITVDQSWDVTGATPEEAYVAWSGYVHQELQHRRFGELRDVETGKVITLPPCLTNDAWYFLLVLRAWAYLHGGCEVPLDAVKALSPEQGWSDGYYRELLRELAEAGYVRPIPLGDVSRVAVIEMIPPARR